MARATRQKKDKEEKDPSNLGTKGSTSKQNLKSKNGLGGKDTEKKEITEKPIAEVTDSNLTVEFQDYPPFEKPSIESNVLKCLDQITYGSGRNRSLYLKSVGDVFVQKSVNQLTTVDYVGKFIRRITALAWHEKYPYALASASKFGDIMFTSGIPVDSPSSDGSQLFETKAEIQGGGAGYSITAMKFHDRDLNLLYKASIDCTVGRVDLAHGETKEFYNTEDYNRWFCSMDVSFVKNFLVAGDNKGLAYQFSLDGNNMTKWRLHKDKIHHCEFSKRDPNIFVTASLDKAGAVKIWDVRFLKEETEESGFLQPLCSLPHSCGLNVAKFSPVDGNRLLTSDQKDEIRIYQGPLWKDYLTIKHYHKQFQHITAIKADWHPLNDYVVIGRYPSPKAQTSQQRLARAIEFFDSYSGKLVDAIYPPLDEICSLNVFNPTGEYLATGMNSKLVLWKPGLSLDATSLSKVAGDSSKAPLSESTRNILRGRRAREYSPDDSNNEGDANDNNAPKKKRSKTASTASTSKSSTQTKTKTVSSRKKK